MRAGTKIIVFIIIVAIIGYIALTYAHSKVCRLMSLASPSIANQICSLVPAPSSALPNSQIINGSLGNINGVSNYDSQYKIALNITKKYNESINHLVLFSGNSSNVVTETNNQEQFSTVGTSFYDIEYDGMYIPLYYNISEIYSTNQSYFPALIGKTVMMEVFDGNNNNTIMAPYAVQSEKIIGTRVYWHLIQDTGISNSTATNNGSILSSSGLIGIYYSGTEILFPRR